MDNVPRIPMFIVPLKISPVAPDISPIKKKIRKRYGEQTFINEDIFRNFLALRTECCKFPSDENSLVIIKRYYAHLMLLKNRIDLTTPKLVEWPWQDAFYQKQFVRTEITYEEAAILYGLGAAYAHLGRKQSRMEGESMKTACTYFQCAAWIFQSLRERYGSFTGAEDMTGDLFHIYSLICLSQAQECIAEKAIADKRSPSITAKLVKNLAESYERCAAMVSVLDESVPPKFRKDWSRVILIKKSYYSSLVNYFLALDNANEMKFGITVAHYKLAQTDIEEAWRVAKTFTDSIEPQLGQSMIATIQFAREIIVKGCADAIKDNSQIYHELVPQPQDLAKIEGACLAKPTPFDYTDREVIGEDIFKDLLPLKTLKASSVYSEKKADFLRKVLADVEEKDTNLSSFLSSLNLDPKELLKPDSGLPQALLDQCAKFNAMECSPESQLTAQMSALVDISVDVEADLEELSDAIQRTQERLNAISPTAPASKVGPIKEQLNKVFDRYGKFTAAKAQAKESNTRLHEALTEHLKTLHILTRTPEEIEATLPNANHLITDSELLEGLDEAARILSKVEEMRAQRTRMLEDLRAGLQADDITQELLTTSTTEERNALFQRHLDVHQKAVDLLNLNLTAQENISRALIDAHAKVGVKKHDILKCRRQRAEEIDDLVRSGEAYDDLILKCGEGQAFYHDISERLTALHTDLDRINIAIDDLEMKNTFPPSISAHQPASAFSVPLPALIPPADTVSKGPPRLRDVMRARAAAAENDAKGQPGIPLTNPIQVPPAIAPGAQAYWQPSPPTQVWQPNVTTSNTSTPAAVEPAQPSPTPNATAQQQGQFMQTSQMVGYPGSYYQSPYFACIQYPSRSPVPQQNQAFGQRPQQYPSVTGYPHQQYRPTVPPVQQNPSPLPLSGSQSSLAGMINQQYRPPAPVIQQSSSHIPHLQNQGSLSGVMNQSQQQCQPTIPPVQQSSSPLPQSESQTSLPGISNLPQQQYGSNTPPVQQQFGVPVQPAYPQKIRHSISVRPILPMPDQNQQQYRPVVPVVQPTMSQSIRTTTPMPQPIQSPFKSSNPSPQPTQSTSGAPLKFSEMMSRTQYGIPSPSLFQPTPQATVQPPPAAVTQLKPATPDTTTTETTGTNTQKMKFSEMMSKGYGSITPTPTPQFFGQVTPVISQPNGNKQNPQQPPQVYAQYAGFGTPNYGQLYHAGQQYPYAFQQPGIPSAYNPSVIATSQSSQQQNGTSAVSKQGPKVAEKAVVSTPNPQEVKKEAPIPTAEVKISSPFEEILPEDTTLQPTEPPQPTAVEFVPESVASLDAINTPEDQEKEPITPTVLTQADLEVQRREKHLRAIYDTAESGFVSTYGEAVKSVSTSNLSSNLDSLSDQLALNRFIDSTERLLTWIETMNDPIQTSTDSRQTTRLEQSWSRLNEIASQIPGKRPTQAAARCSASKNRCHECIAYDFNRVQLKRDLSSKKDDYINASNLDFVSSLGEWCPRYLLTQAPLPNTVADFWSIIFDQACELIIMTLPPRRRNSVLPSSLDPPESYAEGAYGDPADSRRVPPHLPPMKVGSRIQVGTGNSTLEIRLQAIKLTRPDSVSLQSPTVDSISRSTCIERILTLRNCGSQQTRTVVHLCYSGPIPNSSDPCSISSFTAFVQTAVSFYKQQRNLTHPIAVVSEDGGGLGGVFVASSAAILYAEVLGRIADICELAGFLCQQRRAAINQPNQLGATYSIVGLAAKQSLARRDIIVGPSSNKSRNTSTTDDTPSEVSKTVKKDEPSKPQDFTSSLFSAQHLQLPDMMSALGFAPAKLEDKSQENMEKIQEVQENKLETESNGVFRDLPSHLVDLSLTDESTNGSPSNRRHYLARDFTDPEYKKSRDGLASDKNPFGDLDPLNQVTSGTDN